MEFGRTTDYGSATASRTLAPAAGPAGVSVPLTGLAPGTTFHYRLVASSAGGTSRGADRTFTTGGSPDRDGGRGAEPSDRTAPLMRVASGSLVARAGRVTFTLRCPLAETLGCRGLVRLVTIPPAGARGAAAVPLRLANAALRIGGGQARTLSLRLTPRARALVRNRARLRIRAVVVAVDAAGNRGTISRRLVLRRAARG